MTIVDEKFLEIKFNGKDFYFDNFSYQMINPLHQLKPNTKTQILFLISFDFGIHFKEKTFFSPFVFLSKCIKKSSNFHLNNKKYFGF